FGSIWRFTTACLCLQAVNFKVWSWTCTPRTCPLGRCPPSRDREGAVAAPSPLPDGRGSAYTIRMTNWIAKLLEHKELTRMGHVYFLDPSLVDDFWKDPQAVQDYFAGFGLSNIRHFLMTTQQFVASEAYRSLGPVGIVFVDGYHSEEQARFDYEAFAGRLAPN